MELVVKQALLHYIQLCTHTQTHKPPVPTIPAHPQPTINNIQTLRIWNSHSCWVTHRWWRKRLASFLGAGAWCQGLGFGVRSFSSCAGAQQTQQQPAAFFVCHLPTSLKPINTIPNPSEAAADEEAGEEQAWGGVLCCWWLLAVLS